MLVVTLLLAFAAAGLAAPAPQLGVDDVANSCSESCAIAEMGIIGCQVGDLACWCPRDRYFPGTAECIRRTCDPAGDLDFLRELEEQCSRAARPSSSAENESQSSPAATSESQDAPAATSESQDSPAETRTSEDQDSPVATSDTQDSPAATGVDTDNSSPQATGQPPNPTSANVGAENGAVRMKGTRVKTVGLFLAAGIAALVV
ncbi:hypothetical protein FA15DRAFT_694996 [Coprinopsis marcescibilis]|uniref:CFEM domain-containing protein n=1 Tax=Coprinopsis marcescibilis TaxID=230819 RepID=A0A5C3KSL6_COPMA|nr:hypothetical protein FA15DRAFT_694996 [Coprinopsis marcescibilis]